MIKFKVHTLKIRCDKCKKKWENRFEYDIDSSVEKESHVFNLYFNCPACNGRGRVIKEIITED